MKQVSKVVLAGCGAISSAWLNTIREMPNVELVGMVDLNGQTARTQAKERGFEQVPTGTDLAAMLTARKPDIVFDCTIPAAHKSVTLTALAHGCHVMGEKPLADTMANARDMVAAAHRAGRLYAVMQNRRYLEDIRRVRAFLASGAIGEVHTVHSDFFLGPHFGGFRDRMEHVLLLDMAIHTFDAARFISRADPQAVLCHEWNPSGSWYDHDASAVAVFEMTRGVVYTYRGSWCSQGLDTSWEAQWRITGTRGSLLWDGGKQCRAQALKEGAGGECVDLDIPAVPYPAERSGHPGAIREFVECVQNGGTPETVCDDNIKSLAMVHGAIESAERKTRVELGA